MVTTRFKKRKLEITNSKGEQTDSGGTGRLLIPSDVLKGDNEFDYHILVKVCSIDNDNKVYLIPDKIFDKVDLDTDAFDIIDDKKIDKQGKISITSDIVKQLGLTSKDYKLSVIDKQYLLLEEI